MQIKKRLFSMAIMVMMLCMTNIVAYAHEIPDINKKGSIKITMLYDNQVVKEGSLTIYKVGSVYEDDGNYKYELSDQFSGYNGTLEDIQSQTLAKELNDYRINHNISGIVKDNNGIVCFSDLDIGLYLVELNYEDDMNYEMDPFLVSIPLEENGKYIYNVDASPKLEITKVKKPVQNPEDFKLPQTGQLNWPIPVLAVMGLSVFSIGWIMRFWKREDYL